MEFLLTHWHCVLPAAAIIGALFFMRGGDKKPDGRRDSREKLPGAPDEE
jgi:hypothetical protein